MRLPKHRLFDYTSEGKGVDKNEPPKKGMALFWDILVRRFWKMVSLNFIYIIFSIPSLIITWFAVASVISMSMSFFFPDATLALTLDSEIADIGSVISLLCMYVACVIYALFGGGAATAGMTYVIRNYRLDRHAWVWADFWSNFKKFFLKGTAIFVIDTLFMFILCVNFCFYGVYAAQNIGAYLLQGLMVVIFLIFFLMHAYIYPVMITFEKKKIFEIYKNSFILAIGKLPITFASMALCLSLCGIVTALAFYVTVYAMLLIPIIMFAFVCYVNLFITYPVVQKYLSGPKKRDA